MLPGRTGCPCWPLAPSSDRVLVSPMLRSLAEHKCEPPVLLLQGCLRHLLVIHNDGLSTSGPQERESLSIPKGEKHLLALPSGPAPEDPSEGPKAKAATRLLLEGADSSGDQSDAARLAWPGAPRRLSNEKLWVCFFARSHVNARGPPACKACSHTSHPIGPRPEISSELLLSLFEDASSLAIGCLERRSR